MSRIIQLFMKELDGYDEERELFEEIEVPQKSIIDIILEQVDVR